MPSRIRPVQAVDTKNAPQSPPWVQVGANHLTIQVSVRPASRKRGVLRIDPAGPVVGLLSPPEKGRANRELIEFMAKLLDLRPSSLSIVKGQSTRQKVIRAASSAPQELASTLARISHQEKDER